MSDIGSTATEVTKTPQVTEQMERLDKAVSRAADTQNRMESKMESVMVPISRDGEAMPQPPEADLVPLANQIRCLHQRLDAITDSYSTMLELLEL